MRLPFKYQFPYRGLGRLAFVLIVLSPLLALIISGLIVVVQSHGDWLQLALPWGRRGQLLWQSFKLALGVAIVGTGLGGMIASVGWQHSGLMRWRWGLLPLLFIPPYIHALAWSSVGGQLSAGLTRLGLAEVMLPAWLGCLWIEVMAWLPISVGLLLFGLTAIPLDLIQAAQLLTDDVQVLRKIILPLTTPSLWASGGLLFLLSLTDYSIPSLFGVSSYSLEIFAEYSASNEPIRAFFLALPLLVLAALGVFILQAPLQQTLQKRLQFPAWAIAPRWPTWFTAGQLLAVGLGGLQILVPLGSLWIMNLQGQNSLSSLEPAFPEMGFTFGLASLTALICVPLGLGIVADLSRNDYWGWVSWLLITGALALPGPLVGVGLISLWNHDWGNGLYGTAIMPLLAHLARFTPIAALILFAQGRQLDPTLWDSTRLLPGPRWRIWLYLRLPLFLPGLLIAVSLVFALSVAELGATLIVVPPGHSTLTLRIYNYLHYGASAEVALLCFILLGGAAILGGLVALCLGIWSVLLKQDS